MSYVPVIVRRKSLKIVPTSLARLTIKTPETDLIYWISISSFLLGDGMCALVVELTWVCPVRWCDVGDYQSLLVTSWPWTPNIKRANRLSQAHSMRIVGFLLWRRSHEGKPCWAHFSNEYWTNWIIKFAYQTPRTLVSFTNVSYP